MDRRMRTTFQAGLLTALAAAALTLSTCDNANILAKLTTEVKKSTGKLLIVNSVTPGNTSTNVNPGAKMTVTFDRSVDVNTVNGSTITISPVPSVADDAAGFHLEFSYNDAAKTLYLDPFPWLGDNKDYTLTITRGVKGTDGSELENDYSWAFQTGTYPKGTIKIEGDNPFTNKKGASQPLSLSITCSQLGYGYRLGGTEAECLASATWYTAGSTAFVDNTHYSFPTGTLDGTQPVYIQFEIITDPTKLSAVRSDTIVLDTVKPTITPSVQTAYHNSYGAAAPVVTGSDDRSGVDSTSWTWTNNNTNISPLTGSPSPSISVTGSENTTYPVTVTVKDNAGNTSDSATVNVIKDTVAPNAAPTFTLTPSSPAFTPAPRWTWIKNSTGGGETTPLFTYSVVESAGKVFYSTLSTTGTSYTPKISWPDYTHGMPPGTYTLTIRERDAAGNTSAAAASAVTVTSVVPISGQTGVSLAPTLQWWTMADPKTKLAPKSYALHYGTLYRLRYMEIASITVDQPTKADPSCTLSGLQGSIQYLWYVQDNSFGQRSPSTGYWSFTTAAK